MATQLSRKRKAEDNTEEAEHIAKTRPPKANIRKTRTSITKGVLDETVNNVSVAPPSPAQAKTRKRQRDPSEATTPQHKRLSVMPPSPVDTPTRGTSRLLDRLNLAKATRESDTVPAKASYSSPPQTPSMQAQQATELPPALKDTVQMLQALLNAYVLYLAHHGIGSPLYMQQLLLSTTSTWKKRKVSTEDVRRLLGVLGESLSPLIIVDNGDGTLSVEPKEHGPQVIALQMIRLVKEYESRLAHRWSRWSSDKVDKGSEDDTEVFLDNLPLAPIIISEVALDASKPTKGSERLGSIRRNLQDEAKASALKTEPMQQHAKTSAGVEDRGESLIDRILAKERIASSGPRGPTREELDRIAALDRIEEAVLVLGLLAGGRPRSSFSLQTLVQHLQNSMRNPISKQEAEKVIGLMASEVCPRFVSVIRSGSLNGVVVTKLGRPDSVQLRKRLVEVRG